MPISGPRPLSLRDGALLALLASSIPAQCPPGAQMPRDLQALSATPAAGSAAAVRWQFGQQAIADGERTEAQRHLIAALQLHPSSRAILLDLVRAAGDDTDQQLLWAERYVRAAIDERGRLKLDRQARQALPTTAAVDDAQQLAHKRAQAIREVARLCAKQRPGKRGNAARAQLLGFGAELLLALGHGAPGPLAAVAADVQRIADSMPPDYDLVWQALLRVMRQTPPADADPTPFQQRAIRAARVLVGLARQAAFRDLQGPTPPDMTSVGAKARVFLRGLDDEVQSAARVWTIAELEALSPEQREQFTYEHDTWQHPGVALSTTDKYRIETICGHETLLETAKTVELHHARLANHYDKDPFGQRQGTVRVVPESEDLETEGAPYWWAGGFQSGDRTTVRFAWGTIPGLGRLLTHELTHRFDGVLRPFLRSWYVEGHAVWTGGHYARMTDPDFVDDHLDLGAVDTTWRKDYGRRDEFEKLLRGDIEEYRDNYPVGYSLYSYLRSWPPKQPPIYRDALERYEKNARGGQKDPVGYFEKTFCDGENGRPATLDEFIVQWQAFLRGIGLWRLDRRDEGNEWVARYGRRGAGEAGRLVLDRPTWSWARSRHEPFFGQDHAAAATLLLGEAGDHAGTIAAGLWSIKVDGWRPDTVLATLQATRATTNRAAAQAFGSLARARFPAMPATATTTLHGQLPRTLAFVTALGQRAVDLQSAGATLAAAALAVDHDALATRLDLPPLPTIDGQPMSAGAPPAVPRHLGGHGWTETSLTGYDERRVEGLWYATPSGDLHVGRNKPRDGTGTVDRRARQRHAFVHTVSWQAPGAYVLRGRVHFTTSYVNGAIVFGHARRDRNLRLHFSSGDFDYAIGRTNTNGQFGRIRFRLQGLWERDGQMPGTRPMLSTQFSEDNSWFDYELQIRGPRVLITINDEEPVSYAVHDGAPIEGPVGFAMGMGAIRVQEPTVQRLDGAIDGGIIGLDVARQPHVPLERLMSLPTRGIPVHPDGTLVLWVPSHDEAPEEFTLVALPRCVPVMAKVLNTGHEYPQPWLVAVPATLEPEYRAEIQEQLGAVRPDPVTLIEHRIGEPFTGTYPWVLFVDGLGVLRAAAEVSDPRFHSRVQRWSRMFRLR